MTRPNVCEGRAPARGSRAQECWYVVRDIRKLRDSVTAQSQQAASNTPSEKRQIVNPTKLTAENEMHAQEIFSSAAASQACFLRPLLLLPPPSTASAARPCRSRS